MDQSKSVDGQNSLVVRQKPSRCLSCQKTKHQNVRLAISMYVKCPHQLKDYHFLLFKPVKYSRKFIILLILFKLIFLIASSHVFSVL